MMSGSIRAFLAVFLAGAAAAHAQEFTRWTRQFGSSGAESVRAVRGDGSDAIVGGYTNGALEGQANLGSDDFFVIRLGANGETLWARQIGTPRLDVATDLIVDRTRNIVVAGHTEGDFGGVNAGSLDACVSMLSPAGVVRWTRQFGTSAYERLFGMVGDSVSNIVVVGDTDGSLHGQPYQGGGDALLVKLAPNGARLWTRMLGVAGNAESSEIALKVAVDPRDDIVVAGQTGGALSAPSRGNDDVFVAKYSSAGGLQWVFQTGTPEHDRALGVAVDTAGSSIVTGLTAGNFAGGGAGGFDIFVLKLDRHGRELWRRQIGTAGDDRGLDVTVDDTGQALVVGWVSGELPGAPSLGAQDAVLLRFGPAGNLMSTAMLGSSENDAAAGVDAQPGGHVFVTGWTFGSMDGQPNRGQFDGFVARRAPTPFTNLSSSLEAHRARFAFTYSGPGSGFHVDVSMTPDMSLDVSPDFVQGPTSPLTVGNPQARWEEYRCGRSVYWQVWNQDRTLGSQVQLGRTPPCTETFTELDADFRPQNARFTFAYPDGSSAYHIDLSTSSDMVEDMYVSFAGGAHSPLMVHAPQTVWDKYLCSAPVAWPVSNQPLYWRVWDEDRTVSSPIQAVKSTMHCDTPDVVRDVLRGDMTGYHRLSSAQKDEVSNLLNGTLWIASRLGGFSTIFSIEPAAAASVMASGLVRTLYVNGSLEQIHDSRGGLGAISQAVDESVIMVFSPVLEETDYRFGDDVILPKIAVPQQKLLDLVRAASQPVRVFSFSMGGTITAIALDTLGPEFNDRVAHYAFAPGVRWFCNDAQDNNCQLQPGNVTRTATLAVNAWTRAKIPTWIVVHPYDATRILIQAAYGVLYGESCAEGARYCTDRQVPPDNDCLPRVAYPLCGFNPFTLSYERLEFSDAARNSCTVRFVDNRGEPQRVFHDLPAYARLIRVSPDPAVWKVDFATCP